MSKNTTKHTPPQDWECYQSIEGIDSSFVVLDGEGNRLTENLEEAPARLIAAAPALLQALERLGSMEAFTATGWGHLDKTRDAELLARIDYAQAALAQAHGRCENDNAREGA